MQPAFPEALSNDKPVIKPTATSSGRRLALANWLASPNNPLTARVYVNRVWNEYFGKGIIGTVSDFGKAGDKPTNPELLDYLADNFVKEGWSVKKLHRQILLSSVYRQSSDYREDVARPTRKTSCSRFSRASASRPRKSATPIWRVAASSLTRSAARACSRRCRPI